MRLYFPARFFYGVPLEEKEACAVVEMYSRGDPMLQQKLDEWEADAMEESEWRESQKGLRNPCTIQHYELEEEKEAEYYRQYRIWKDGPYKEAVKQLRIKWKKRI